MDGGSCCKQMLRHSLFRIANTLHRCLYASPGCMQR